MNSLYKSSSSKYSSTQTIGFLVLSIAIVVAIVWYVLDHKEKYTPEKTPGYESFNNNYYPSNYGRVPLIDGSYHMYKDVDGSYESAIIHDNQKQGYITLGGAFQNNAAYADNQSNRIIGYVYKPRLGPLNYNVYFNAPCESKDCVTIYKDEPFLQYNSDFNSTC